RGDLAVAFERLRNQLEEEGLFDPSHKKPIPRFPQKIGIVTSADAAALRDIVNVLRRRYPLVSVLVAPTLVQGNQAPAQIVRSLKWLDGRNDIDTILVTRGGGAIEDLWAFNDEEVARAIFNAKHPIISGVGHEIDFTISDFVADLRAPTPSAAAELAVPDREELLVGIQSIQQRLAIEMTDRLTNAQLKLQSFAQSLQLLNPQRAVDNNSQKLDTLMIRLDNIMYRLLEQKRTHFERVSAELEAMSPLATLGRGYAIVRDENGRLLRHVADIQSGMAVEIQLANGTVKAIIQETTEDKPSS
ncbi:MAG: exodeoxyribonuclease VII large subunit, partial [Chloroflexota bacterium]